MPPAERHVLTAPDVLARAAAAVAPDRKASWMLRQSRELRQSFADEVLDAPDRAVAEQAWMLRQPRAVREAYLDAVVAYDPAVPREEVWMLRQSDKVCRSYVDEVLLPKD